MSPLTGPSGLAWQCEQCGAWRTSRDIDPRTGCARSCRYKDPPGVEGADPYCACIDYEERPDERAGCLRNALWLILIVVAIAFVISVARS